MDRWAKLTVISDENFDEAQEYDKSIVIRLGF